MLQTKDDSPNGASLETHVHTGHVRSDGHDVNVLLTRPAAGLEAIVTQAHRPLRVATVRIRVSQNKRPVLILAYTVP